MNTYLSLATIFGNVMLAVMATNYAFKALVGPERKKNALLSVAMFAALCPLLLSGQDLNGLVTATGLFGTIAAIPWFIQKQFERAGEIGEDIAKKVIDRYIDKETGAVKPVSAIPGQQMLYYGLSTEDEDDSSKKTDWLEKDFIEDPMHPGFPYGFH